MSEGPMVALVEQVEQLAEDRIQRNARIAELEGRIRRLLDWPDVPLIPGLTTHTFARDALDGGPFAVPPRSGNAD